MSKPSEKNNLSTVEKHPYLLYRCSELIKVRPRSEKEIRIYLTQKKAPQQTINEVVDVLKEKKLIDDAAFVAWWVDQRVYFRKKSNRAIRAELMQKGVSRELVDGFFAGYENNELDRAVSALVKARGRFAGEQQKKQFEKSVAYLLRRGFTFDIAKKAFEQLVDFG